MGSKLFSLRRAWLLGAVAALGCLPLGPLSAATFPNLYRVTVPPDPSARNSREAATAAGLAKLLVRITGSREAPLNPQLMALANDPALVNSYGIDLQGQLQIGFNAQVVDRALTNLGLPVCGAERPLVLVWVAVDDGLGGRALLSSTPPGLEASPALAEMLASMRNELAAVADERGLPLTLPVLDLEDLTAVTFADVWGGFDDRVAAASARYRADGVLIGRVRPGVFGNEVQWLLLKDGERRLLDGVALRDGLDAVADLYAAELCTAGTAAMTRLDVLDVSSLADYGRVMSYLEGLSVLQGIDVESFDRGVLRLRVTARGDAQVLERVLALGGVLRPANPVAGGTLAGAATFRVNRGASGP